MNTIIIVDASLRPTTGEAGWGAVIISEDGRNFITGGSLTIPKPKINRVEAEGACLAIMSAHEQNMISDDGHVLVVTDSEATIQFLEAVRDETDSLPRGMGDLARALANGLKDTVHRILVQHVRSHTNEG